MQTRSPQSLAAILLHQTHIYLTEDNPERKGTTEKIMGLFAKSGVSGRHLALDYQESVIRMHAEDEDLLLRQVTYDSLSKKGALCGSTKYRRRLMEGLCEYYGLTQRVDQLTLKRMKENVTSMVTLAGPSGIIPYPPSMNSVRDALMKELLENALIKLRPRPQAAP